MAYRTGRPAVKNFLFLVIPLLQMLLFLTDRRKTQGELPWMAIQPFAARMPHKTAPPQTTDTPMRAVRKINIYSSITKNRKSFYSRAPCPVCQSRSRHATPNLKPHNTLQRIQFHLFKIRPYLSQQTKLPDRLQYIPDRIQLQTL